MSPPRPVYLDSGGARLWFSDYPTAEQWGREQGMVPRRTYRASDGELLGYLLSRKAVRR